MPKNFKIVKLKGIFLKAIIEAYNGRAVDVYKTLNLILIE